MNQFQKESEAWQKLVNSVADKRPDEGKIVIVKKGKHEGKRGVVKRHQKDRYDRSNPGNFGQELMREATGTFGYVCLIKTDGGE